MRKFLTLGAMGAVAALALAGCGSDSTGSSTDTSSSAAAPSSSAAAPSSGGSSAAGGASGKVGVILPDTQSSVRWETADRPYLQQAFQAAGIEADIQNAQGDKTKMASIADGMIQSGVKVLIITNLDSPSGAQIEAKAKSAGIKTIDYDRLTLGGSADYYVSFDNTKVGELQGDGLIKCIGDKANARIIQLNGSPTDNNATLFKQGAVSKLQPKYDSGWKLVGDQAVPNWDNAQAATIFQQLLTAAGNKVDGVLAANDGLGNAAITVLKSAGLKGVPVTGQDATVQGLQNILRGDQCMTVYKAVKKEADGAAKLAIALIKGEQAETNGTTKDATGNRDVPSVLLTPEAIFKDNVKDVVADNYVKASDLCTADLAQACKDAGVS
ncbi:MAG: sugar ABC transporter substrate-binding protein [Actinomycetales bacterium]